MQQEKKGLFGRLLDFWKEKTEEAGGGIGFWSGGKTEGKTTAENRQDALPQEKAEKKPFFWEETVRTAKGKKAEEAETFGQERRRSFAEEKTAEAKGPALRTAEESTQERKTIVPIFTGENGVARSGRKAENDFYAGSTFCGAGEAENDSDCGRNRACRKSGGFRRSRRAAPGSTEKGTGAGKGCGD